MRTPITISAAVVTVPIPAHSSGAGSFVRVSGSSVCDAGGGAIDIGRIGPKLAPVCVMCGPRLVDDAAGIPELGDGAHAGMLPLEFMPPASVGSRDDDPVEIVKVLKTLANWSADSNRSTGFF